MPEQEVPKPAPRRPCKWEKAFLADLALSGVVTNACRAARVNRCSAYEPRERHAVFREAWDRAQEEFTDSLEKAAIERARDGTRRYHFDRRGRPVQSPVACECGHARDQHAPGDTSARTGACAALGCTCAKFLGAPHYDRRYSGSLRLPLRKAGRPLRYSDRYLLGMSDEDINMLIRQRRAQLRALGAEPPEPRLIDYDPPPPG